jgi:ABC-type nitrate/sulfonate/bicarbonate transport system substrate-binding protein
MSGVRNRARLTRWAPAVAVLGALLVAACGNQGGSSSSTTQATSSSTASGGGNQAVKSSLVLGINNPNYATQAPIFIAREKGFFKDVGIQKIRVVTTDNFVQGLVGGSLDISQGDTDQWLGAAAKSDKPIKYVATYRDKEWHIIGGKKGVDSTRDLAGKTVTAGERGGRNEFVIKSVLKETGVDASSVKFVPLGGGSDARLQALINGQVDGASIFPRHMAALQKAGGKVLYKKLTTVPQEGIAVMGDWLAQNEPTLVAYLTATLKARQYMADPAHKAEVVKIMRANKFELPDDFVAVYKTETDQISKDGGFDPAEMDSLVKEEQDLDLLPAGLDWRKFVDLKALYQAQKALGMRQRPAPSDVSASGS